MGQMAELENTASRKVRLYIFIDALGWELAERYHFCADFLPCRYDVVTQLGYSAGAVPTILTGKTPPEHGHFSFFYYDPHHSPFRFLKYLPSFLLPDIIFSRHRIRHHISKVLKKVLGYTGYFQLYRVPFRHLPYLNYSEKRDMFIPGGMDGVPNLADAWQGRSYHISDWRKPGMFNFQEAEELLKRGSFECAFIYDAALDGFLHRHIGEPEAVRAELKHYEERMRRLYEPMEWSSWSAILVMSRIVIIVAILLSSISFIFVSDKNPLNLPSAKSKVSAKYSIGINTAMLWDLS